MALKLKRKQLERIVYDELTRYLAGQLNEAPPGKGTVLDDEIPDPDDAPEEQLPTSSPADEPGDAPEELPTGEEPADGDLEADMAGEEEGGAEPGTLAAELEGKTIESVSMDDDSKIMPGAMEVVLSFKESPDALRLLLTKTGKVKIFYKGLHNDFGSPVEEIPGEEPEEDLGAEEEPGPEVGVDDALSSADLGDETEEMPPLSGDDLPPAGPPEEEEPPKKSKRSRASEGY